MIVALLAGWPSGANAAECPTGFDWPAWLDNLESVEDNALIRRTLTANERLLLLRDYNNEPPITDRNPDRIEIFSLPGIPLVMLVFVKSGCVTLTKLVSRWLIDRTLSTKTNGRDAVFNPYDREA